MKSTMIELVEELEKIKLSHPCEEIDYLINEAKSGEYHDFKNRKYSCGKMGFVSVSHAFGLRNPTIAKELNRLSSEIKNGDYDERQDDIDKMKMCNDIMRDSSMSHEQKNKMIKLLGLKKRNTSPFGKQFF